ncbi:MAG: 4Fe-4S dicluster domain-containing protein [Catonella sp.]|nr:4Fe-4S dicluster domain-containing protein [Catonella sp.]MDY6356764.1 4Fe-4S dicluster domain-containing protein [Catonella sp.]
MQGELTSRAAKLLEDGTVNRVLGWSAGDFVYDITPTVFDNAEDVKKRFVYDDFCGANLSKYLVEETQKEGKIAVFLKPCDTYSFNQLLTEHRIKRENVYVVGIECDGKVSAETLHTRGIYGIIGIKRDGDDLVVETAYGETRVPFAEVEDERCLNCKSKKHVVYDELIGEDGEVIDSNRFDMVAKLEAMTPDERYKFWQGELSRCIRCNACRNVCPACTCEKCVFDNPDSGIQNKAASNEFEEKLFHFIRAYHVAGRCTDCGECSRVCPENIPLHLLNRKFIKDYDTLYGDYQAGAEVGTMSPLNAYTEDKDAEPSIVREGGIR